MLCALFQTYLARRPSGRKSRNRLASRSSTALESLESRRLLSAVYHVAATGNDAAAGSEDSPFRTLQKAANSVRPGDTVIVHAGNYAGFDLRSGGTATARITFRAEPGVVINAANGRTGDGINLEGADYVTLEGFTVVGMPRAGIRTVTNRGVEIRGNTLDQNGRWGIFTAFSDDVLIEKNTATRSVSEHGIYVSNSGDRPIVRDNTMWGNSDCGLHMNGDVTVGGDGIITGALVERNVIYDNGRGGGSAINADGVQNSVFRNNLLYNNHAGGFALFRIDGGGGSSNNLIVNNTVVQASDARWAVNINGGSTGNVLFNNIILTHHPYRGSVVVTEDSLAGFRSDYNVITGRLSPDGEWTVLTLPQWQQATGQDAHSVAATPDSVFVNAAAGDFRLKSGSPAVDLGVAAFAGFLAPMVDLAFAARPQGLAQDAGAYESAGVISTPGVTVSSSPGSVTEGSGEELVFTFSRTGDLSAALTAGFAVGGAAAWGADYTASGASAYSGTAGTVTFAAGSATAVVRVRPTADAAVEADEAVTLTLTAGAGYAVGAAAAAAGTITNDDHATPPPSGEALRFDFGTATSPLAAGYARVGGGTKYSSSLGYGWLGGAVDGRDRASGTELTRDFVFTADATFAVDLADGTYRVTVTLGDAAHAHDRQGVYLEGTLTEALDTAAGQFATRTYTVAVTGGRLELRLADLGGADGNAVLNALEIEPADAAAADRLFAGLADELPLLLAG